jgi:hypothetical protein
VRQLTSPQVRGSQYDIGNEKLQQLLPLARREYCDEGISAKSLTGRPAAVAALEAVRERNAAGLGGPLHRGGGGYEPGMCGIAGAAGPHSSVQLVEEMCRRK